MRRVGSGTVIAERLRLVARTLRVPVCGKRSNDDDDNF